MSQIIKHCTADLPHPDWKRLGGLDYRGGVAELVRWLPSVLLVDVPRSRIEGLWFGLYNPLDIDQKSRTDIYVAGSGHYDKLDQACEWAVDLTYKPSSGRAYSSILHSIYDIAYAHEGGLQNDAEWALGLAFAVMAVPQAAQAVNINIIPNHASVLGVATGFDSGDSIQLGEITEHGFSRIVW
jgi:hypothetical protein